MSDTEYYVDQDAKDTELIALAANLADNGDTDAAQRLRRILDTPVAVEPSMPGDGDVIAGTAYHTSEPEEMHVLIVLPGFTTLTLAMEQPVDESIMETFSDRDLAIMLTLLRAAEQEISTAQAKAADRAMRERYGDPFPRYPCAPPVAVPAPAPVVQP